MSDADAAAPRRANPQAPSPQELRQALGRFTTGVTIVTCRDANGVATGLTANSFSGVSLAPPLVLWSLRLASPNLAAFSAAAFFTVNAVYGRCKTWICRDSQYIISSQRGRSPVSRKRGRGN